MHGERTAHGIGAELEFAGIWADHGRRKCHVHFQAIAGIQLMTAAPVPEEVRMQARMRRWRNRDGDETRSDIRDGQSLGVARFMKVKSSELDQGGHRESRQARRYDAGKIPV